MFQNKILFVIWMTNYNIVKYMSSKEYTKSLILRYTKHVTYRKNKLVIAVQKSNCCLLWKY